uniref:Polycystic kidney disease 1b n=1 Tax=Oncorhynchus kisutch TaxID=8019 RepID=A0A8C7K5V5_ONCKI
YGRLCPGTVLVPPVGGLCHCHQPLQSLQPVPLYRGAPAHESGSFVYPDDILSIQHTGRPGTFLSCRDNASSSSSPWRQSYLSLQGAEWGGWWEGGLSSQPDGGQWVDGVVCDLRVLYVDTLHGHGYISSSGQSELSGFTHIGNISTTISMTPETSAPAPAKSQISGLCMIHPLPDGDNQIHILVDTPILIVVKIFSGKGATSSWLAPVLQTGVPFLPSCPGELPDSWPGCERDSPDSWFSHMSLVLPSVGVHTLNVSAVNGVSEQSTCVQVCVYEPVAGLSVEPHGHLRMLVDLSQGSISVYSIIFSLTTAGSGVGGPVRGTLPSGVRRSHCPRAVKGTLPYIGCHLSDETFKNPKLLNIISCRWSFGDGSAQENQTFPALSESQDRPVERGVTQVYVQDSVSHVYLQPDDYTLTVQVYNQYDNIKRAISLKVRPPLTRILISPSPPVPLVNQTFLLEASSYPFHYGILYTWNFGDGSKEIQGFHSKVSHVARTTGVYNMTVCANNTLTALTAWVAVAVVEKVSGLQLRSSGHSELKSATEIKGKVASGSSLHWDWDFGDGTGHKNITDNSASHVYESPGSYTVKVTVSNAVSQASQSIRLEVYRLAISGILPSECSETEKEIPLQALVNGNVSMLTFHWNFGDGSPLSVQKGKSVVTHTYSNSGVYNVNVTVLSIVGYVFYDANVCIEAPITGITIHPSQDAVAVGKEVCFNAVAAPKRQPTGYQFLWLNHSSNSSPIRGLAHHCFVYKEEGIHDVSVMASNKVSQSIAKATVAVQKPVSKPSIAHSSQSNTLTVNEKMTLWVKSCPGTNVSVQWDFGDGSPLAKSLNVSHVFTSTGRFTVKATASNAVSLDSVNLEVNVLLPVSDLKLKISQPFAVVGEKTVITAFGNVSGHVNFYWSVDGPDTTTELGMSHFQYVFLKAGVYQVKVTAQNLVSQQEAAILIIVLERIQGLQFSSLSLTSMNYIPTRESVLLTASVTHGSNVTYHWLANQRGVTQTGSVGENFVWFTETPGNISVELTASNGLGKTTSRISLKAVERVSGARMSTARDTIPLEKYTNISVTVETGSDLQYLWNVNSELSPLQTDVPFLLYKFETLGSCSVSVSVQNVLSSSNATKHFTVQEEVREADFQVGGKTHPFFITSNTQVALYGYVNKGNGRHWEWKVVGCTGGAVVLDNNQSVIYTFTDVGVYNVSLNVSNGISWQAVSHRVTIQDAIQGLTLNLSRSTVCAEDHIAFTPLVSKGTNVSFSLAFDEVEPSYDLVEVSFTTSTLPVGSHSVTARAWNKVSNSQVSLTVQVVERIGGLRLVNCCSTALEALKEVPFQAIVMSGSPTDYTWTIQLEGFQPSQVIGQEVIYTSPGSGSLSVGVMASNGFCSETLNETAIVQLPVREVTIVCDSTENFRGYSVRFSVTVDGGSNLRFQWGFGDSSEGVVVTKSNRVDHTYLTAGKYIVQVTAFNNVSQVSTQLLTEVRELQCSLPQVTLVQGQSTIVKSRSSYFEASVDIKGCTAYKTMYLWEVFRGSVTLINLVGVTTPLLSLAKQALEVGQYCLGFTVSLQGTPLRLYRTSRLSVVHSSLVPIIRGGSLRLVSSHSDLILDGSESHDPDGEEGELNYHWEFITEVAVSKVAVLPVSVECVSCSSLSSFRVSQSRPIVLSGRCDKCGSHYKWSEKDQNGVTLDLNKVTTTGSLSPELVVRPGVLQEGCNYTFTLNVTHPAGGRWGFASLTLLPNPPPHGGIQSHLLLVSLPCFTMDRSIISVILQVEDHLGSKVTALNRTITVLRPVDGDGITEWLRNKSQTELSGLLQQGNPQQLIPYSIALTSQLNQVDLTLSEQDLRDKREIRGNVTQALASLSVYSLQDAAQISLALAQSTVVPSEVVCEGCQENVLDSVGRMIRVLEEQTGLGDDTAIDTGRNILHIFDQKRLFLSLSPGNSLAAVFESKLVSSGPRTHSNVSETAVSALDHARALMLILMRSRPHDKEPLSLSAPQISAVGYHGNPSELLCTTDPSSYPAHPPCQFLIPSSLSAQLQRQVQGSEVVQILLGLEGGSEFFSAANPPISTSLAAMEFTTPQGQPIPIANLDTDRSIRVTLPLIYTVGRIGAGHRASGSGSGSRSVRAMKNMDPNAGLYISLNFSLLPGASLVGSGHVTITVATQPGHPASHDSLVRELTLSLSSQSSVEDTIFLSPLLNSTVQSLFVNLTSSLSGAPVQASVCVFSSLCQYYSPRKRRWSTEGLRPLEGSTLHSAHCLTQHLTMFGASLFVHPDAVVLLGPMRNVVVGIVCAVLVLIHFLLGLIAHKLDHLESLRLCHVPLCGRPGRYSYKVLVKTGWRRGAGTTAHVGISLYGVTKSGSRHLQREGAFQRSGLDLFHLETDSNLGEVWKIRLWHDNTGLDPSWYVQHVVVWNPQTDHLFYFLVEDWLSVENDRNEGGGTVEKEMLASCPEELSQFQRVLSSQLAFGMLERHLWLSLWERPAHSRFMRGQRVTVCALLLHLYLALGALWYGAVGFPPCFSPHPGVARGKPSWLLPPWALQVIYPLVVLLLGACLAVVGLYGSHFSRSVVLMWLISALSAFLTSALLLEFSAGICETQLTLWEYAFPIHAYMFVSQLFSRSVDGFLSVYQAGVSVLSVLRGRLVLQRLSRTHPVLGPLYALSLLALGGWLLARLSGSVLLRTYRVVQAEMYRPAMESQDYEMVEFFIKRLKLWMGLIKAKEFRHRVKFEGMVVPPSRSSQGSCRSTLSSPHPLSSALSLGSEDSGMSDVPGLDVQLNLDRLLSCVNGLLSRFDRVNQLTADVQGLETQLEEVQSRRRKRRPQRLGRGEETSEERGVGGGAMGRRTLFVYVVNFLKCQNKSHFICHMLCKQQV